MCHPRPLFALGGNVDSNSQKKVLVVTENGKTKFVPPDDPNARLTSLAQVLREVCVVRRRFPRESFGKLC
jgi:hypothetical protein